MVWLACRFFPYGAIYSREVRVAVYLGVDFSDVEPVGEADCSSVYLRTADDVEVFIEIRGSRDIMDNFDARRSVGRVTRQHNIATVWQRLAEARNYGFKRRASHRHRVARGNVFEVFEVGRQLPRQVIPRPYNVIFSHRHYNCYHASSIPSLLRRYILLYVHRSREKSVKSA